MASRPTLRRALPKLGRVVRRFGPEIRGERRLILGAFVALLLESAFRLAEPWPLKFVLDAVVGDASPQHAQLPSWLAGLSTDALVALAAVSMLAIAALRALSSYLSTVGLALAGTRVLTNVRGQLYRHLQRLSLNYHAKTRTGDLVTRVTGDVGRLQEVAVTAVMPLVANSVTLIGMLTVMLLMDWRLGLVVLAILPLFGLTLVSRARRIRVAARRQRTRDGAMASTAAESMSAIKVVQAYSLEERLEDAFGKQNRASLKDGVQTKRLAAGLERKVDVLTAGGTAVIIWFGARLVARGELTPGDLVVFVLYLKTAFKPLRDMAKYAARLSSAAASGERVLAVLDTAPKVRDRFSAVTAPPLRGDVRFQRVTLAYEPGHEVLRDVSLEVRAGQRIALVGPSGGGKSTLASLLPRLYDPDRGAVLIDGRDLRDYTLASLRSQIAIVLQDSVLFAATVRDNIAWGTRGATDFEIQQAASLANAHDFIKALPDGYETVLGERGATLSGGQRQRIAIARAAVRRAAVVVLDEPTTGLDEHSERAVIEALQRLTKGRTTFVIAHELEHVREADSIVYIEAGRLVEQGTHDELITHGGRYARAWLNQQAARAAAPAAVAAG